MGLSAAADVRFDYVASLQLARRLWALGDEVDELMANRVSHARTALTDWLGRYGTQFADRIDSEAQQATAIANDLRTAAEQWAVRWAEAMNEQNRILHARETKRGRGRPQRRRRRRRRAVRPSRSPARSAGDRGPDVPQLLRHRIAHEVLNHVDDISRSRQTPRVRHRRQGRPAQRRDHAGERRLVVDQHDRRVRRVRQRPGTRGPGNAARRDGGERDVRRHGAHRAVAGRPPRRRSDHDLRCGAGGGTGRQGRRHTTGAGALRSGVDRRHPADVGLRRRPDLCGERQHDPSGHRPAVPGGRRCVGHHPHVQLRRQRTARCVRCGLVVRARRRARGGVRSAGRSRSWCACPTVPSSRSPSRRRRRRAAGPPTAAGRGELVETDDGIRRAPRPRATAPLRDRRLAHGLGGRRRHRRRRSRRWTDQHPHRAVLRPRCRGDVGR